MVGPSVLVCDLVRDWTANFGAAEDKIILAARSAIVSRIAPGAFVEVIEQAQAGVRLAYPFRKDPEYFVGCKRP
jgi:hypothetical protein